MIVIASICGLVILLLCVEAIDIRRRLRHLPIRIHVNGTRGKSSVTEYIAVGLRASDRRVFAKITGVHPTIFLPNGDAQLLRRRGPARMQEQVSMIRKATEQGADAIVLECMSISPEFQRMESRVLRPTVYVLTNIRDDHKEELGAMIEEHVEAICSAIPANADVVTAEQVHLAEIRRHVERRRSRLHVVRSDESDVRAMVGCDIMPVNAVLAATACEIAGGSRIKTLAAIRSWADSKMDESIELEINKCPVRFVNGFAVNDTPSAEVFLRHWESRLGALAPFVVLFNTRSDRPLRSADFATWLSRLPGLTSIVLTGTHVPFVQRSLKAHGVDIQRIVQWSEREVRDPRRALAHVIGRESVVVGLGNVAGDGFTILDALHGVTSGDH